MRIIAALLIVAALASPRATQGQAMLAAADGERLDSLVRATMTRLELPGVSYAIAIDGQIVRERGFGLADVENGVTATPATVYPIASLTKSITAVAAENTR